MKHCRKWRATCRRRARRFRAGWASGRTPDTGGGRTPTKIGFCGFVHETNTFSIDRTDDASFERYTWRGGDIADAFAGTRTSPGGVIDAVRKAGHDFVPLIYAEATPSGIVAREAYRRVQAEIVAALADHALDALVVTLHGAMAAEGTASADEETLRVIRGAAGDRLPVAVTFDLHGNIAPAIADLVQAAVGYDTYPHVDAYERAAEAADIAIGAAAGRLRPVLAVAKLPLLSVPQGQFTAREPMRSLIGMAHAQEERAGVLACSVLPAFAYADVPNGGLAVTAVADGSPALAASGARTVAERAWDLRDAFTVHNLPPEEAVAAAMGAERGLAALVDVGDNIGGGTPGDGTVLLAELLRRRARGAIVTLADSEAVDRARTAGVGGRFEGSVGGKADQRYGEPVRIAGTVYHVGDGRFRYKCGFMTGKEVLPGLTAVVEADGVEVVLTEHKTPTWDPEQLRVVGVEPTSRRIIVLKAAVAWRAGYEDLVDIVIEADTPGACASNLGAFNYLSVRDLCPLKLDVGRKIAVRTGTI